MVFNNEKGSTLNYKHVVDSLVKISNSDNIGDYYTKVFQIISQNIDSNFFAIGLFKEKSNCINLRLQDKLGNNFSTKVFLKDEENPIVQVFKSREMQFVEKKDYLKLSYYKNYSTAILPLISINKCIGVFIIEDTIGNVFGGFIHSKISNYTYLENDDGELKELKFKWFNLEDLKGVDFRPKVLAEKLAGRNFNFEHIITKD